MPGRESIAALRDEQISAYIRSKEIAASYPGVSFMVPLPVPGHIPARRLIKIVGLLLVLLPAVP